MGYFLQLRISVGYGHLNFSIVIIRKFKQKALIET